jgi:hypothetical protein
MISHVSAPTIASDSTSVRTTSGHDAIAAPRGATDGPLVLGQGRCQTRDRGSWRRFPAEACEDASTWRMVAIASRRRPPSTLAAAVGDVTDSAPAAPDGGVRGGPAQSPPMGGAATSARVTSRLLFADRRGR